MPLSTMEVSCHGQQWIGHAALNIPQLCVILLVDGHLHGYGLTHIRSHAASDFCPFQCWLLFSNVRPGSYLLTTIFKCASRVIFSVATIAASWWVCLHVVHILQHPTCHPTTRSTQYTMVNAPKKNPSPLPAGKYGKSMNHSTRRSHQANEGKSGL